MTDTQETMPIAIVGLGCRLPGGATSPEKLWDLLIRKQSARKETPRERFNIDAFYHPNGDKNGTLNNRAGHFLDEDISAFDAPFFSISPAEAHSMDPMQRILLEVVYEAMESAGIPASTFAGTDTSCFVGCFTSDYDQIAKRDPELLPKYHSIGTGQAILSNRISYCFDLQGPSVTLDTACSSSLVAVHLACQSLRMGESKTAIVGATHAILNPDVMIGMTNLHFLSPDSKCYTFDARANGYARGEGMAALILKPLSDAIQAGDTIRAVIRGTAVNSNGKTTGITLPSRDAQVSLIRSAYQQAGCDPAVTGYCEAHGTGTAAGDPLEAGALGEALGAYRSDGEENKLFVGSIKTNIGHLEGASGLAALVKTVMSLEKGVIAPNLWYEKGNPAIEFDAWRIRVPTEASPWPAAGLRRASVNGFGYGGTNGHVILDDAYHYMRKRGLNGKHQTCIPSGSDTNSLTSWDVITCAERPRIFYLSAHEPASVLRNAKLLATHLESHQSDNDEPFLDDLAFTLCERRSRHEIASTVIASSKNELIEGLESLTTTIRRSFETPGLGFIFTGQGAQWWAMGRELMQFPVFAQSLATCEGAIESFGSSWSLLDELMKDRKSSRINEAEISQPLCSALQIALVDLYASWNIHPIRVIGHSSGEVAAAYATGALDLESAMRIAFFRGLLSGKMRTLGYKGGMMAAGLSERDALEEIESLGNEYGKAVVACVNSPQSVTLSGDLAAIKQLQQVLTSRGIFARKLEVEIAYHSHHMLALADEYRLCMTNLRVVPWEKRNDITMFSSVTGRAIAPEDDLGADYWVDNMVSCVRFSDALMDLCKEKGLDMNMYKVDILVEIGPHAALAGPVKQTLASLKEHDQNDTIAIPIRYLSTLVRGVDAVVTSLTVAGSLCTQGYSVDLHQANFPRSSPELSLSVLTDLPTYSWNHERKFWSESRLSHDYRFRPFPRTDLLGAPVNDWNPMQPRWRNFIRLAEQPWVRSHVVQGAIVYPAAGFCCMALEAALQLNTMTSKADKPGLNERLIAEYNIRSLDISRALVVPETEDGVEVMFSMLSNPTNSVTLWDHENEFRIFSYTTSDGWAEHCRGFVSVFYQGDNQLSAGLETEHDFKIQEAQNACQTNIPINEFYTSLNSVGLYYGPEFQGVVEISTGHGHALGTVQVTDTASEMPKRFQFEHLIHPATLDTFLQVSIAALSDGDIENLTQAFVPTKIEEIRVSGDISLLTGHKLQVAAETGSRSLREVHTSVMAVAGDGLVVQMQNITLSAIASFETRDDPDIPNHTAIAVWEPDVDLLSTEKMNQVLQASLNSGRPRPKDFELLAYYYFDRVLNEINANEMSHMHSHHQKFFRYMQHQRDLVLSDKHEQQDKDWKQLSTPHVQARLERLIDDFSDKSNYEGRMFVRMGEALTSVLRKEVEPLALMMEDNLLHDYYTVALGMDGTYPQIARYISLLSHKYPDLDYLEIGAGTGGCTVPVLQALSGTDNHKYPRMKSYTYTDISSGFFEQAAEKFSSWGDMIQYAKLDIEQDPQTQAGFENRRFDVIIAANVLHATFDMNQTIRHARKLLREGGKLVLLDMTHSMLCVSLIFGNLPGWWNCSEPWREYGPLLSEDQWREVFLNNHFTDFEASSPDLLNPLEEQTRVMISTATGSDTINGNKTLSRALILTPDTTSTEGEMVTAMSSRLNDVGISTDLCTLRESQGLNLDGTAIISFVELDKPLLAEISARELTALQHIIQASVGLVWVTRGGTATKGTRPELSMFQGMARSLRAERENVPCVTVDLDAEQPLSGSEASGLLLDVFMQSFGLASRHCIGVVDREFSEERGMLKIKRAIENPRLNQLIASRTNSIPLRPELQDVWESSRPLQVKIRSVGMLDSLAFHDGSVTPHQLPEDHVEIEVRAVGLNSRDVQTCLGEVSDDDGVLGHECAGVITQTGSTVQHVAVGDRVLAWGRGLLSTVVQTPGRFVQKIPSTMSYAAAAAFPLAYVTAYYSLVHVACLQSGDTVLISNAASSVGRAAMHIARLYGAEVFVTVGSEEMKRDLIEAYTICENHVFNVSSERDVAFVDRILRATKGRGVDIVFNDLVGKAFQATYKVVAPFGRFLEIGNNDNALANRLELSKNTTFTRIDVFDLFLHNSKLAANIFSTASRLALEEYVQGSSPLSVRPFSKAQDSIRLIKDRKQEGKIVLEPLPGDLVQVMPKALERIAFNANASYLLSGGLGGLGRSISRWMVSNGARNLIYVARHGASSPEASTLIRDLNSAGVRTEVIECDVTDSVRLSDSLSKSLKTMPPIHGVIQGAMVLQDQIFSNMTFEAFTSCIRPKVQGSWALHQATIQQPLDFFVLLSSCASFWGNAGQTNYAAGCTYQGTLATHRQSLGLPASSIDIGKVANVGFVAENAGTTSEMNLLKLGLLDISENELLAMLELAMLPAKHDDKAPGKGGNMPNGHLLTGLSSSNDISKGDELPFWSRDPVFSHMSFVRPHLRKAKENLDTSSTTQKQQPLPILLSAAGSAEEAEESVLGALMQKLTRSLMMRLEEIDAQKPMAAYGVDSLVAVELRNWFSREAKVDLAVFDIVQAKSLIGLAKKVAAKSSLVKLQV